MTVKLEVNKDINENLKDRYALLDRCYQDKDLQQQIREYCARDIKFWIDAFCWTYNPNTSLKNCPFILLPVFSETQFESHIKRKYQDKKFDYPQQHKFCRDVVAKQARRV